MNFFLGVTDNNWFNFLNALLPDDVNFWQPGGNTIFKALQPGAPFLFKLKNPINAIGGMGFFSSHTFLPLSIAWDTFEKNNGCNSYEDFKKMILNYRADKTNINPMIGCIVLTNPIFFKQEDWIKLPQDWHKNIVQGKSYSTETAIGNQLWQKVNLLLEKYLNQHHNQNTQLTLQDQKSIYGQSVLTKIRLGQGAFRVLVTDAYTRRCAVSGEKTLPVLEAAHIKPYAKDGPHLISNALLLRSDLHKLFDAGYITITTDFKIEVSNRIKEEYENGREYYKFHGDKLHILPTTSQDKPSAKFIEWHNSKVYNG